MNIIGQLQRLGTAIYRLVDDSDSVEAKKAGQEGVENPSDNDGPGAGGGYLDADSVEIQPASDNDGPGAGAGGGYDALVEEEESGVEAPSDGPGAGGGYDDADDDGPGAGGGYDSFQMGDAVNTVATSWGTESMAVSGYFLTDATSDEVFSVSSDSFTTTYPRYDLLLDEALLADSQKVEKK